MSMQGGSGSGSGSSGVPLICPPGCGRPSVSKIRTTIKVAPPGLCKKLTFAGTPDQDPAVKEAIQMMTTKIQVDHDVEVGHRALQRDALDQRLKSLRELLKLVGQEDWMYPSADRLIGLQ